MGLGAVGLELAESLSRKNGINVAVIDTDSQKVESAVDNYDVLGVVGNGITFDTLKEANVDKAEILIATTSQDERNILCCIMGKKFGAKTTIIFRIIHVITVIFGAVMTSTLAWDISDTFNGLMMIPNLIGVVVLFPLVMKITSNYIDRKVKGKDVKPILSYDEALQAEAEANLENE